jgi:ABC-type Fe3+-hydroxamate transport system substrate-binding protein
MPVFKDQTGNTIRIKDAPQRIISLVPSQTELLYDLGLNEEVIGITKFCVHPKSWHQTKTRIGGTKNINIETVHQLSPDLIIGNKEENTKEQIEELGKYYPVWLSDVNTLEDAYNMIQSLSEITGTVYKAQSILQQIQVNFKRFLDTSTHHLHPLTAAYFIWKDPYMVAGSNTFIHSMMNVCGFSNIFSSSPRYPVITPMALQGKSVDCLLLSSEPFPFKEKHVKDFKVLFPGSKVLIVDGEMFSWYGSRLIHAGEYFMNLRKQILEM